LSCLPFETVSEARDVRFSPAILLPQSNRNRALSQIRPGAADWHIGGMFK